MYFVRTANEQHTVVLSWCCTYYESSSNSCNMGTRALLNIHTLDPWSALTANMPKQHQLASTATEDCNKSK